MLHGYFVLLRVYYILLYIIHLYYYITFVLFTLHYISTVQYSMVWVIASRIMLDKVRQHRITSFSLVMKIVPTHATFILHACKWSELNTKIAIVKQEISEDILLLQVFSDFPISLFHFVVSFLYEMNCVKR